MIPSKVSSTTNTLVEVDEGKQHPSAPATAMIQTTIAVVTAASRKIAGKSFGRISR